MMVLLKKSLCIFVLSSCCLGAQAANQNPTWSQLQRASAAVQVTWAKRYEHGQGIAQDFERAIRLYCAAARKGHAAAQYQLGWLYANSRGIKRDDALAAAWFRLAARKGHTQAKNMLSLMGSQKTKKAMCGLPKKAKTKTTLFGASSAWRKQVKKWVYHLAPDYGLDPSLVLAVIEAESAFVVDARSPKNAQGLMQLLPATAKRFGVRDLMDPIQNLRGGMAYLRWLLAFFQGNVRLTLAGYNAGEKAVLKYRGIPPFAETKAYIDKITRSYKHLFHPPVAPVVEPSSLLASIVKKTTP